MKLLSEAQLREFKEKIRRHDACKFIDDDNYLDSIYDIRILFEGIEALNERVKECHWFIEQINQYVYPGEMDTKDAALHLVKQLTAERDVYKEICGKTGIQRVEELRKLHIEVARAQNPYRELEQERDLYRAALEKIAEPTYGTELCNTDEENNEILAQHHFSNQEIAKKALAQYNKLAKEST